VPKSRGSVGGGTRGGGEPREGWRSAAHKQESAKDVGGISSSTTKGRIEIEKSTIPEKKGTSEPKAGTTGNQKKYNIGTQRRKKEKRTKTLKKT